MRIIWTREAAQDRADIWDYLYAINPKAAIDMDNRLPAMRYQSLRNTLTVGPAGIIAGTTRADSTSELSNCL